jgi:predicted metal-dependent peptidase
MTEIKDKKAREKVVRARTNLLISNGFFGFLALQLRLVEATEIGGFKITTMAVDGKNLYYCPEFVNKLEERELEGVVAHEVMHCAFSHFSRRQDRNPTIWNIAGDFVINNDLVASGFSLPGTPLPLAAMGNPKYKGVTGHLLDPTLDGLTTEEVYDRIPVTVIQVMGGSGKKGDSKGDMDPGGCGGVLDAPGNGDDQEQTKQTWEVNVRQAIHVAKANNIGSIPGSLRKLMDDLQRPKISWRDLTRAFIDQSLSKETTWSRPSRRSVAIGALLPGYISDRLNHLVFVVDTSGSVDTALLREFLSEVAGALDQGTADQLTVLYADTRVHDTDNYVPGDLVKARDLEGGGGGTDFEDSFRFIKEKIPDASCVIYLTDLQVYNFGEDPGCPTLWAVYAPTHLYPHLAEKAPFGSAIHVGDRYG